MCVSVRVHARACKRACGAFGACTACKALVFFSGGRGGGKAQFRPSVTFNKQVKSWLIAIRYPRLRFRQDAFIRNVQKFPIPQNGNGAVSYGEMPFIPDLFSSSSMPAWVNFHTESNYKADDVGKAKNVENRTQCCNKHVHHRAPFLVVIYKLCQ